MLESLLDVLEGGDVVYDIGSNIGQYTVVLAKVVGENGQVVAFEPQRDSYDALVANVKLNGLEKVQAYRVALGEDNRAGELLVEGTMNRHSKISDTPDTEVGGHLEQVDVVRGDDFVVRENLPLPRAVKVDVEGYEYYVLRGLQQTSAHPSCELLVCEIHHGRLPQGVSVEDFPNLVTSLGFSETQLYQRGTETHMIARKGTPAVGKT